jgi:hypothetical protein
LTNKQTEHRCRAALCIERSTGGTGAFALPENKKENEKGAEKWLVV